MIRIHSLIETKTALADDWRAVRKTDLASVSVAGQCKRNAVGFGLVKMIRIVSQQKVRRPMARAQPIPVRFAKNQIVNAADDKLASTMPEVYRLGFECSDSNRSKMRLNVFGIHVEVVMISVTKPRTKGCVRQLR